LTFTRKVVSAYRRGDFENLFIVGPQGMGKTTYAMLVLYEVYRDWDKVLEWLVFDPREVLPRLKQALRGGKRVELVVFDDAGIHLSKYLWSVSRESQRMAMYVNALFNVVRSVCAGVIFTSPDMDVLKELRKKSWWVGEPKAPRGRDDPTRVMVLYRKRITVTGAVVVSRKAEDVYDLRLIPQDVRREYEEKRKVAVEAVLNRLERLGKQLDALGTHTPLGGHESLGQGRSASTGVRTNAVAYY